MSTAEMASDLEKRDFLTLGFARRRSRGGQPPTRRSGSKSSSPQLPDWKGLEITRREALIIGTIAVSGIVAALLKPWDWLRHDEVLDARIVENARGEILRLDNYAFDLRQKIVDSWLPGRTGTLQYIKDSRPYLLSINPAKANSQLEDLAVTNITLERRKLSIGGSALVFVLSGSYNPTLAEGLPELIKNRIRAMNFEHEAIVSLALINGLITTSQDLGVNFSPSSEVRPQESQRLSQLQRYVSIITSYAEAVAEANDYILTYPFFDKNPQGQVEFVKDASNKHLLPRVNGLVFPEGGLTFIVDQTIGATLKEVGDLDQLAQRYPSLEDIPRSSEYLEQIQQHFQ